MLFDEDYLFMKMILFIVIMVKKIKIKWSSCLQTSKTVLCIKC